MQKNILNNSLIAIFCFLVNVVLFLQTPQAIAKESFQICYTDLIKTYKEFVTVENNVFEKLVFTPSDFQFKKGTRLKLILEDQFGRKWIFKPGNVEQRSMVVYRLFMLFGLESPETHIVSFIINGKQISGSMQMFITHKGTLDQVAPNSLSKEALSYLLKEHVLTWLIANYDAQPVNFLVISSAEKGKINKIVRVDYDSSFLLLGQDNLEIDYISPWQNNPYKSYYTILWKSFIAKDIFLDLKNNYRFVLFVSYFPNDFFEELISPAFVNNNLKHVLFARKHNMVSDFENFYSEVLKMKGEIFEEPEELNCQILNFKICRKLKKQITRLRKMLFQLQKGDVEQKEIRVKVSVDGFEILKEVYQYYWLKWQWVKYHSEDKDKSLVEMCYEALEKLEELKSFTSSEYEKLAIMEYINEIEKIKSGKKPSYIFYEINKVNGSIVIEE